MRGQMVVSKCRCLHMSAAWAFSFFAGFLLHSSIRRPWKDFPELNPFLQCAHIHSSYRCLGWGGWGCDGAAHTAVSNRWCTLALPCSLRCCNNNITLHLQNMHCKYNTYNYGFYGFGTVYFFFGFLFLFCFWHRMTMHSSSLSFRWCRIGERCVVVPPSFLA